jgi:GNAT acetyltransferase-like protein
VAQLLIPHSLESRVGPRPGAVVEIVSPAPRDIWHGVLRDDPGATTHLTPEYFDAVVAATGGTDVSRFYQLRDGRQLLLPLVRRPSRFGLHLDASYPDGFGPGGMLATGGLLADDVRLVVKDLWAESLSVRIGGAHHTSEQWSAGVMPGVSEEERRVVGVIDLTPDTDGHAKDFRAAQLDGDTRQRLRRAVRMGVEVEKDTGGRLLPVCYDVYRAGVEREVAGAGLPTAVARRRTLRTESYADLAAVAAGTGEACRTFVAWFRGRPVAAAMLLVHGDYASVWRSFRVPELATPVSADLLTLVTAVEDAVGSGCRSIDLVPSWGSVGGPHHKNPLGASARSVVDLRIEPAGLARLRAAGARAEGVLIRALTRSPASSSLGQPTP